MKKIFLTPILIILFFSACAHLPLVRNQPLTNEQQKELYANIAHEIETTEAIHLKECNCMKAFYRDLFASPNDTARYIFDSKVGEQAPKKNRVNVLAIGSGTLLNELTALANILARGKSLNIYLTDHAYVFYGDPDYEKKALDLAEHPEKMPESWKDFYFWPWAKNKEQPYLPFFAKHHQAIEEFKTIIMHLDQIYGTKSSVEIIKPAADRVINLPPLDVIIAIDAFIDLPNLMWNLFYQLKLDTSPVRFVALNKTKPLGGFWDSPNLDLREAYSLKPVSIDIYDVSSEAGKGCYKLVERKTFEPTKKQIKNAPEFRTDPKKDSTQSPLEIKR